MRSLARSMRHAAAALVLAWALFATWRFARSDGLVPNAFAGDVTQSAAAVVLLAGALFFAARRTGHHSPRRGLAIAAVALAAPVVATLALGLPWLGLPPAPVPALVLLTGVVLVAASRAKAAGAALALAAWAFHALRLLEVALHPWEVQVAIVSYAIPSLLALAPLFVVQWTHRRGSPSPTPDRRAGQDSFAR